MQEPGFWDGQEQAAKVSAEHASAGRKLESFRKLESELDDLEALEELAAEDDSIAEELEETRGSVQSRLDELELERLFSGPYDSGDAVVSVHAGAGGADSPGWGEMLPRVGMRWAERGGVKGELGGGRGGG